jgi:Bacterial Ig-like domain (group 2)
MYYATQHLYVTIFNIFSSTNSWRKPLIQPTLLSNIKSFSIGLIIPIILLFSTVALYGCDDDTTKTTPKILQTISVSPSSLVELQLEETQLFTALGTYDDGSDEDLSSVVTWISSDSAVATIDASGIASALSPGTTEITASYDGITSAVVSIEVIGESIPVMVSIVITPGSAELNIGETVLFTATANYDDYSTIDITDLVLWESDNEEVAIIATATATALLDGTALITASYDSIESESVILTVLKAQLDPVEPVEGDLVINELLVNGNVSGDANGDGSIDLMEDAFVELVNVSGHSLTLLDVIIYESTFGSNMPRHTFGDVILLPGQAVVVFGGGMAPDNITGVQYFTTLNQDPGTLHGLGLDLNNDTITIETSLGTEITALEYGGSTGLDANIDQSINLSPEVTGSSYSPHSSLPQSGSSLFSPGTYVDGSNFL